MSNQIESVILVKQNCPIHEEREISWICLENNCENRLLCNLCAVKSHDRDHKVEEYDKIKKQGFINVFFGSQEEYKQNYIEDPVINRILEENNKIAEKFSKTNLTNSQDILDSSQEQMQQQIEKNKKLNDKSEEDETKKEIEQNITFMTKLFEHNLRNILQNFENMTDEFRESQIKTIQDAQNKKETAMDDLVDIEKEMVLIENNEGLQDRINEALRIVNEEAQSKEEIPALQILIKKSQLVVQLKQQFIQLTKNYLENRFTTDLCNLFDQQLQTIQKQKDSKISDEELFLDYLKKKWNKDQSIMENSIQNVINQLNQILKSTLTQQIPNQQQQQPKLTVQTQKFYAQQQPTYIQTASGIQVVNNQQYQVQQPVYSNQYIQQTPISNPKLQKSQQIYTEHQQKINSQNNFQGQHSQISNVIQQQNYYQNQNDQVIINSNEQQEPSSPIQYLHNKK